MLAKLLAGVGLTFLNYKALEWLNNKFKIVTQSDPKVFFILVSIGLSVLEILLFSFFTFFLVIGVLVVVIWYGYSKILKTGN
jgi:hypothetical protein